MKRTIRMWFDDRDPVGVIIHEGTKSPGQSRYDYDRVFMTEAELRKALRLIESRKG